MFNVVKNFKKLNAGNYFSHYERIINDIKNNKQIEATYKDYIEIYEIFKIKEKWKIIIFSSIMNDSNFNQYEVLQLCILYGLNYKLKYKKVFLFLEELKKKNKYNTMFSTEEEKKEFSKLLQKTLAMNNYLFRNIDDIINFLGEESLKKIEQILFETTFNVNGTERIEEYSNNEIFYDKETVKNIINYFDSIVKDKYYAKFQRIESEFDLDTGEILNLDYTNVKIIKSLKGKIMHSKGKFPEETDKILNKIKEEKPEIYRIWEDSFEK